MPMILNDMKSEIYMITLWIQPQATLKSNKESDFDIFYFFQTDMIHLMMILSYISYGHIPPWYQYM